MLLRLVLSARIRLGLFRSRVEQDLGATAVEYALMLAFIAAVVIAGITLLGHGTDAGFQKVTFPP